MFFQCVIGILKNFWIILKNFNWVFEYIRIFFGAFWCFIKIFNVLSVTSMFYWNFVKIFWCFPMFYGFHLRFIWKIFNVLSVILMFYWNFQRLSNVFQCFMAFIYVLSENVQCFQCFRHINPMFSPWNTKHPISNNPLQKFQAPYPSYHSNFGR